MGVGIFSGLKVWSYWLQRWSFAHPIYIVVCNNCLLIFASNLVQLLFQQWLTILKTCLNSVFR